MIKLFVKQQGWGIIDAGQPIGEVLVLETALAPGAEPLLAGARVTFDAEVDPSSPTGTRAARVTPLTT